jgi:hypothetical protein
MGIRRLRAVRHTATRAVVAAYLLAAAVAIAAHKPADGIALVVALATGAVLASLHPWNGQLTASTVLAAALVAVTATGVAQPRRVTRLRWNALQHSGDAQLAAKDTARRRHPARDDRGPQPGAAQPRTLIAT